MSHDYIRVYTFANASCFGIKSERVAFAVFGTCLRSCESPSGRPRQVLRSLKEYRLGIGAPVTPDANEASKRLQERRAGRQKSADHTGNSNRG